MPRPNKLGIRNIRKLGVPGRPRGPAGDTCTRDVYAAGAGRLPAPALLAVARGVAAAVRHLHRQGVLHGDLYAHGQGVGRPEEGVGGTAVRRCRGDAAARPPIRPPVCDLLL